MRRTGLIVSQAILNTFAVLGLAPLTGVPLPFVSYGSSSLIVMLAAMGLLLNVASGATGHVRAVFAAPRRGRSADARARERDDGAVIGATKRIVIAAGGTAGHVVPALAVADALRAEGAEVCFIGGERAEAELVPAAGFALHTIAVAACSRAQPAARPRALVGWRLAAVPRARSLLKRDGAGRGDGRRRLCGGPGGRGGAEPAHPAGADGGGQPPGPDEPAAGALRAPRVPGVRARRAARAALPRHGAPDPARRTPTARRRARASRSLREETCVLVFGGSLGARSINLAAVEAFARRAVPRAARSGRRDHARAGGAPSCRRTTTCASTCR